MALLRSSRRSGVRRGRDVQIGPRVRLEVGYGGELVLGDGVRIGERTRIVVQGGRVEIGAGALLGARCTIVAHERVTIGASACLQDGAVLVDFDHVVDDVEVPIRAQPLVSSPITIGVRARIGLGASVLRGVSIGARATVGPHAVVTRDVAPGATVAGVPARPVTTLDDVSAVHRG
ncbi:MAG TPA: DapH/DapD/GlmU-related protein [Solirubrobacteraceae bacterium]|nr:DapH/DapD/GlmU-related protein [Solirubrobacteraceae bacterium]